MERRREVPARRCRGRENKFGWLCDLASIIGVVVEEINKLRHPPLGAPLAIGQEADTVSAQPSEYYV